MSPLTYNDILALPRKFVTVVGGTPQLDIANGPGRVFSMTWLGPTVAATFSLYNGLTASGDAIKAATQDYYSFAKNFGRAGILFDTGISASWASATVADQIVITYLAEP